MLIYALVAFSVLKEYIHTMLMKKTYQRLLHVLVVLTECLEVAQQLVQAFDQLGFTDLRVRLKPYQLLLDLSLQLLGLFVLLNVIQDTSL